MNSFALQHALDITAESFVKKGLEYVDARLGYRWGGRDPLTGLDCSGFVISALREVSDGRINLNDYWTDRLWAEVPRLQNWEEQPLRPGDLVFYWGATSKGPDDVSHVMVLLCETKLELVYAGLPPVRSGLLMGMPYGGSADVDAVASKARSRTAKVMRWGYRTTDIAGVCRLPFR